MQPYRILFVCLGNICRSPAGENVMRDLIQKEGITGVSIDSAGTAGYHIGKRPDHRMIAELESRNIRVAGHARQFVKSDFRDFDLIVPMDNDNQRDILRLAQNDKDEAKVRPMMGFCSQFTNNEVPDPYYGGQNGFSDVVNMMHDGCQGILKFIQQEQAE